MKLKMPAFLCPLLLTLITCGRMAELGSATRGYDGIAGTC